MPSKVLWVGVCFDPDDIVHSYAQWAIDEFVMQFRKGCITFNPGHVGGGVMHYATERGPAVEVFDGTAHRIGFGIEVANEAEGRTNLAEVEAWLASIGVTMPVGMWLWEIARADSCKEVSAS